MSQGRQLYELQELDLEIEAVGEALAEVEGQLGESQALLEARDALSQEQQRLAQLEKAQRELEWELDDLHSKAKILEGRLYGGSVKNPKELTKLQEELAHLTTRQRQQEDKVLDIMAQAEDIDNSISVNREKLRQAEEAWRREQDRLLEQQAKLRDEVTRLGQLRAGLVSQIEPTAVEIYEALRVEKQGRAVAKVERGMCQGCRIGLPITELQRARLGQGLLQCSSCGRILYVS